ncbi:MAG: histidine kinase [Cyclobacteriaceae bacterium]
MTRKVKISVLLFIGISWLMSVKVHALDQADSLRSVLRSGIKGEQKAVTLQKLGNLFQRQNPDSVYYYHKQAYDIGKEIEVPGLYARSAFQLGFYFRSQERYDSARFYNTISEEVFRAEKDSASLGKLLIQKGNLLKTMNQMESATSTFIEAAGIFSHLQKPRLESYAMSSLAMIKMSLKRYEEALAYYQQALTISVSHNDVYAQSVILNNMGSVFHTNNHFEKAITCYNRSADLKEKIQDQNGLIYIENNLAAIYMEKNMYDSALYHLERAGDKMLELGRKSVQTTTLHNYAIIYRNLGKYGLSEKFLDSASVIIRINGNLEKLEKNYKHRYRLDSARGDYDKAFENLKMHITYRDSLSGNEMQTRIAEIETRYETNIKNNEIATLTRQSQIDALKIREQNYLLVGAILLILLIIAAAYIFVRHRQLKTRNRIGQIEQKFLRSQMNPHFIFNALGSIQKYMISQDTRSASVYLAKFGKLMRQILEHSRQEFITLEDEIDTLRNYLDIQKLRFGDRFNYNITVCDEIDVRQLKIPPMFAQPFIENALEHGIHDSENGLININFRKSGQLAVVEILDNGKGLVSKTENIPHNSLATKITKERLQIISRAIRKKLVYSIENRNSGKEILGTIVRLTVPYREI